MIRFVVVLIGLTALVTPLRAAEPTYWQDLRPLLRKHCTACHNKRNLDEMDVSGGITLDSYESVVKNAKKAMLTSGHADRSLLFRVLIEKNEEKRMPLGTPPLPAEAVAVFKAWIDSGAKEGTAPAEIATPGTLTPAKTRKLDVLFTTTTTPTAGVLAPGKAAPLRLALKVGPLSPATAVCFSPDGKLLATGSYGLVTIWDLAGGKPVKTLTSVLGAVSDLRFSPDGSLLAVAGGQPSARGDLRLFNVADWKLLGTFSGHEDQISSVAFSPDGKRLATASYDKTVRVWTVASRHCDLTYTGHSDFVHAVCFSPDGTQVASVSKDRALKVIEAATGKSVLTMSDRNDDALSLAWHPKEPVLVASGLEPGITWWDAKTAAKIRSSPGHRLGVHELAFSGDGMMLVSAGGDGNLRTWDGSSGAVGKVLAAGSVVYAAAVNKDGTRAAAGCFDGQVRVFDTTTGKILATLVSLPGDDWLALTPEGYLTGTPKLVEGSTWQMTSVVVPTPAVLKVLNQPTLVAKSLTGQAVPAPVFVK